MANVVEAGREACALPHQECIRRQMRAVKCLHVKSYLFIPEGSCTLLPDSNSLAQPGEPLEQPQPTWPDGRSSSLLPEDPSMLFSGGAGPEALFLAGWETASFGGDET